MSEWLIELYIDFPAQQLIAWNLDVIDYEIHPSAVYPSSVYREFVKSKLSEYKHWIGKLGMPERGYVCYDSAYHYIVEADDIKEAIDRFFKIGGEDARTTKDSIPL